jgi:hypothetical protein
MPCQSRLTARLVTLRPLPPQHFLAMHFTVIRTSPKSEWGRALASNLRATGITALTQKRLSNGPESADTEQWMHNAIIADRSPLCG